MLSVAPIAQASMYPSNESGDTRSSSPWSPGDHCGTTSPKGNSPANSPKESN